MVALSGGAGSLAMLDFLISNRFVGTPPEEAGENVPKVGKEGKSRDGRRFTWRHCWVVHIDHSNILPQVCSFRLSDSNVVIEISVIPGPRSDVYTQAACAILCFPSHHLGLPQGRRHLQRPASSSTAIRNTRSAKHHASRLFGWLNTASRSRKGRSPHSSNTIQHRTSFLAGSLPTTLVYLAIIVSPQHLPKQSPESAEHGSPESTQHFSGAHGRHEHTTGDRNHKWGGHRARVESRIGFGHDRYSL